MRGILVIWGIAVIVAACCCWSIFGNDARDILSPVPAVNPVQGYESRTFSGSGITVFSSLIGNITVNSSMMPSSPKEIRIYRGYFNKGDLLENISGPTKPIQNPVPMDQAPGIARKVLDQQYGGLPEDAELQYCSIMSLEKVNLSTGAVFKEIPYETFVSWRRSVDGMRVEGGSDIIQVELGENGDAIRVYKSWRTLEPQKNVSIISAETAMKKLSNGEVLNPGSGIKRGVSVYDIHLSYYVKGIDEPEVTLEPIWVFYGNASGTYLPFFVYARQFANFTATPAPGKAPLSVAFNDTSDASPTAWYWEFGDGSNSTEQHPVHTYTTGGRFNVSLRVWNDLGSDTVEKPLIIPARG